MPPEPLCQRPVIPTREPLDLEAAAQDAIDQTTTAARAANITVQADLEAAPTLGDRVLVERLATNLVDNAVRYNISGGTIQVDTRIDHGQPYLSVSNTGPLIPASKVASLFEPFTRLDQRVSNGHGVGLGLSIVASVITAHSGDLEAHALPTGGLKITVRFPAAASEPARRPPSSTDQIRSNGIDQRPATTPHLHQANLGQTAPDNRRLR